MPEMVTEGSDVLFEEGFSGRSRWQSAIVALEAGPFGKVGSNVEGCGREAGVFEIDEVDHCCVLVHIVCVLKLWFFDDIATEQIAVCQNILKLLVLREMVESKKVGSRHFGQ
jgi:hypothetical protein